MLILYKKLGETPLECINRYKNDNKAYKDISMTYAGRLDPMASGLLIVLVGDECKNKEDFIILDKEYEVEILFGISTDTGDQLGIISDRLITDIDISNINLEMFKGKFMQIYPSYSSKTVNGVQLHTLARNNELPGDMPKREVLIYSIELLEIKTLKGGLISDNIIDNINKVKGDFRQEYIKDVWKTFGDKFKDNEFSIIKIKVNCSSGTYMRVLAEKIGESIGSPSFAYSIKRIKVGNYTL